MIQPKMIALTLVSVAAFLGASVAAEGPGRFFGEPALCGFALVTLALTFAAMFTRASLSPGVREDRGNRWVIGALTALGFALALAPALCDRFGWLTFGGSGVRWLGVALYAAGGFLRLAPVFALGERFSGLVAIQPGHRLLTTGLYAHIRHPSYLGLLVMCLGAALTFRSLVGVALVAAMVAPIAARIGSEERLLAENFGPEYAAYRARTARLLPGIY